MRIFHRDSSDEELVLLSTELAEDIQTNALAGEPYASAMAALEDGDDGAQVVEPRPNKRKLPISNRIVALLTSVALSSAAIIALERNGRLDDLKLFVGPEPVPARPLLPLPEPLFSGPMLSDEEIVPSTTTTSIAALQEIVTNITTTVKATTTTVAQSVEKAASAPTITTASTVPKTSTSLAPAPAETTVTTPPAVESRPEFRYMSGADFVNAYYNAQPQPDTVYGSKPEIYGDAAADEYIRKIAESRGYRLQPLSTIGSFNPRAMRAFNQLADSAWNEAGIELWIVSGFRSIDTQREIFQSSIIEYFGRTPTAQEILSGAADDAINATLDQRSAPGYSRHHSGYVADFIRLDNSFMNTRAYQWLSDNNFYNARRFGWIPSYPPGVKAGPLPESWEFCFIVNTASIQ